ncbi:MAG TPA: BTAD domain-containing putative transcriptional regulator, partial [Stellaceae bacterium]|nr:BTAD domain-containing putative transcriptional regulator [Stellaceae bacterium]
MLPLLRLSLLGPVSLRSDDRDVRIRSLKLRALLGYIALNESLLETRERLVGLLWSESGEAQARAVLRQVIRELRGVFVHAGSNGLRINAHEIGFDKDSVEVDVWSIIRAVEVGEVHSMLLAQPHLTDELMTGLEDLDPAFRVWLLAKRHSLRDRLLRALESALRAAADATRVSRLAEAILGLDPTHEEACRRLMRAQASLGDTAHALRAYKALWDLLDEDYGMEPSAATQELVAEIKMGTIEAAPAANPEHPAPAIEAVAASETRPMLSVEAVDVRAVDPDKAHLSLGFRQLLIASLVRFREWHVTDVPFPDSSERSARYQIQISAHQRQQALHQTLMLKELNTGFYIWSDSFELRLDDWFEAQGRVVRRIAMALNVYLSAERLRRFSERPDVSIGLYDRWLRCQTLVRTFNPQHWDRLTRQFNEIIEAAPGFVPAYCGLADINTIEHIAHP